MPKVYCIVPAAGSGTRMGKTGFPTKQYLLLGGIPVLVRTLRTLQQSNLIDEMIVAVRPEDVDYARGLFEDYGLAGIKVIAGGETRSHTVKGALAEIQGDPGDLVAIHDGARPLLTRQALARVLEAARIHDAAALGVAVWDTVKRVDEAGFVTGTLPRTQLRLIQTPQVFTLDLLRRAYRQDLTGATDDCALVERLGVPVKLVEGERTNLKITTPEDLKMAEMYLKGTQPPLRIGHGYDVHRLEPGRKLILGGVEIPHHLGLLGHSDADCLVHALMDALLGAVALGDIGQHFPAGDPAYAGIDSLVLLRQVGDLLRDRGYVIYNLDATVVAQRPRLAPYREKMRENIARTLDIPVEQVHVKATTTEGLGPVGEEKCIEAHAVALVGGNPHD